MMERSAEPVVASGLPRTLNVGIFNSDVLRVGGGNPPLLEQSMTPRIVLDQFAGVIGGVRLWQDVQVWQP
jgi:hypothetical protein